MRRWRGRDARTVGGALGAVGLVLLLLAVAPPLGAPRSALARSASGGSPGSVVVAPAFVPAPGTTDLGPRSASTPTEVVVGVGSSQLDSLAAEATLEYTPGTPEYHHFLSPEQVASRFGASTDSVRSATTYFEGWGLSVTGSPDRFFLRVSGASSEVAAAFHT
ncbi:MAG: hypothetical protein L3J87_04800, partial [Thermoplasmata archaeon]|nr:hypothetical protein [Thermoplasmata archaeon]